MNAYTIDVHWTLLSVFLGLLLNDFSFVDLC